MDIRLTGADAEISFEDFRKAFNEKKESIVEVHAKDGIEGVIKRMREIDALITANKIDRAAHYAFITDVLDKATEEERRKIRELDRLYKPKAPSAESAERTVRAAGKVQTSERKTEKALNALAGLGFSKEELAKLLAEKRKK